MPKIYLLPFFLFAYLITIPNICFAAKKVNDPAKTIIVAIVLVLVCAVADYIMKKLRK